MRTFVLMLVVPVWLMAFIISYPIAIAVYAVARGKWLKQATYFDRIAQLLKLEIDYED